MFFELHEDISLHLKAYMVNTKINAQCINDGNL